MAEVRMEIDQKPVSVKIENTDESDDILKGGSSLTNNIKVGGEEKFSTQIKPEVKMKIIKKEEDLAYLIVEGMTLKDGKVIMTREEVYDYLEKAVLEGLKNNKSLEDLKLISKSVLAEMRNKRNEFQKLAQLADVMEKEQLRFLRADKATRKYLTKTGGVAVDLPILPNSFATSTSIQNIKTDILEINSNSKLAKPSTQSTAKILSATPKESANKNTQKSAPSTSKEVECIDLTDESESASAPAKPSVLPFLNLVKHPAPLPPKPYFVSNKSLPPVPPKPRLTVSTEERGIVLKWEMMPNTPSSGLYAPLSSFDIFGYQEQKDAVINTLLWKKIGTVKAMTLPMACTLTQFAEGNTYHFSIRAVDIYNRIGNYSDPISIVYKEKITENRPVNRNIGKNSNIYVIQ